MLDAKQKHVLHLCRVEFECLEMCFGLFVKFPCTLCFSLCLFKPGMLDCSVTVCGLFVTVHFPNICFVSAQC